MPEGAAGEVAKELGNDDERDARVVGQDVPLLALQLPCVIWTVV